jgi:hypothetical protein
MSAKCYLGQPCNITACTDFGLSIVATYTACSVKINFNHYMSHASITFIAAEELCNRQLKFKMP